MRTLDKVRDNLRLMVGDFIENQWPKVNLDEVVDVIEKIEELGVSLGCDEVFPYVKDLEEYGEYVTSNGDVCRTYSLGECQICGCLLRVTPAGTMTNSVSDLVEMGFIQINNNTDIPWNVDDSDMWCCVACSQERDGIV
jgi:hypothetical protein